MITIGFALLVLGLGLFSRVELTLASTPPPTPPPSSCVMINTSAVPPRFTPVATGIDLSHTNNVVFLVKTPKNAMVLLVTTPGDYQTGCFQFGLGTLGPCNACMLRNSSLGFQYSLTTCNYLHSQFLSGNWVWIWISWANGVLTAGVGNFGENMFLYFPDTLPIANLTTIAVGSLIPPTSAQWMFPLNQVSVPEDSVTTWNAGPTAVYQSTLCQNGVTLAASTNNDLYVILTGRTSIAVQFDTYASLTQLVLLTTIDQMNYSLIYSTTIDVYPSLFFYKNEVQVSMYVIQSTTPMSGGPGLYWISWYDGQFLIGIGSVIGTQPLMVFDDTIPMVIVDMVASFTGTLTVPFGYFFGLTALIRGYTGPLMQSVALKKLATNGCYGGCPLAVVNNPTCSTIFCSNACTTNAQCTAFCLQQPQSPGGPCTCQLQAKPGTPSSQYLYYSSAGATYWEMMA